MKAYSTSSVQNPSIIPFNPVWLRKGFPCWTIIIPNIYTVCFYPRTNHEATGLCETHCSYEDNEPSDANQPTTNSTQIPESMFPALDYELIHQGWIHCWEVHFQILPEN